MAVRRLLLLLAAGLLVGGLPSISRASDAVLDGIAALVTPTPARPGVVEVTRQDAIFRVGPGEDFDRRLPLNAGVLLRVTGRQGTWLRVDLGGGDAGWVEEKDVRWLPQGTPLDEARLRNVLIRAGEGRTYVDLQLTRRIALDVVETADPAVLELRLHSTTLMMHEIAQYVGAHAVANARVDQPFPGRAVLTLRLATKGIWGWRVSYADSPNLPTDPPGHDFTPAGSATLRLVIRNNPGLVLSGLTVVVDPGHGGPDTGAVGVGGLQEDDVNLACSLALRDALVKRGARVVMTRDTDRAVAEEEPLELSRRVDLAREADGDVFISIHHNARPRIDDSRVARGTFIYYYRQQSEDLAEALVVPVADAVGDGPRAHVWRSFHVIRQTWMPSVLVEAAFISNPESEASMRTPAYAKRVGEALATGLETFMAGRSKR